MCRDAARCKATLNLIIELYQWVECFCSSIDVALSCGRVLKTSAKSPNLPPDIRNHTGMARLPSGRRAQLRELYKIDHI